MWGYIKFYTQEDTSKGPEPIRSLDYEYDYDSVILSQLRQKVILLVRTCTEIPLKFYERHFCFSRFSLL
jgi:hypothetical protein